MNGSSILAFQMPNFKGVHKYQWNQTKPTNKSVQGALISEVAYFTAHANSYTIPYPGVRDKSKTLFEENSTAQIYSNRTFSYYLAKTVQVLKNVQAVQHIKAVTSLPL